MHHFWHTFDIACTRFSDRRVDQPPQADPVTREAYSREVISFGFWFGDDTFPDPAFYSYTAPEPAGWTRNRCCPRPRSGSRSGRHLAVLRYDDARAEPTRVPPFSLLRERLPGRRPAARGGTSSARLPGGVTDPQLTQTWMTTRVTVHQDARGKVVRVDAHAGRRGRVQRPDRSAGKPSSTARSRTWPLLHARPRADQRAGADPAVVADDRGGLDDGAGPDVAAVDHRAGPDDRRRPRRPARCRAAGAGRCSPGSAPGRRSAPGRGSHR